MAKWSLAVLGLLVGAALVLVFMQAGPPEAAPPTDAGAAEPADTTSELAVPSVPSPFETPPDLLELGEPPSVDAGGALLPSGEEPPPLPANAPKSVSFGVVLVQFRGAQGAPKDARSREEAETLAKELAELAKKDFAAAVKKGDKGSMEDAGSMPKNILEPAPNYVLFTTPVGEVSDPVATPRGFWIVRRRK